MSELDQRPGSLADTAVFGTASRKHTGQCMNAISGHPRIRSSFKQSDKQTSLGELPGTTNKGV